MARPARRRRRTAARAWGACILALALGAAGSVYALSDFVTSKRIPKVEFTVLNAEETVKQAQLAVDLAGRLDDLIRDIDRAKQDATTAIATATKSADTAKTAAGNVDSAFTSYAGGQAQPALPLGEIQQSSTDVVSLTYVQECSQSPEAGAFVKRSEETTKGAAKLVLRVEQMEKIAKGWDENACSVADTLDPAIAEDVALHAAELAASARDLWAAEAEICASEIRKSAIFATIEAGGTKRGATIQN